MPPPDTSVFGLRVPIVAVAVIAIQTGVFFAAFQSLLSRVDDLERGEVIRVAQSLIIASDTTRLDAIGHDLDRLERLVERYQDARAATPSYLRGEFEKGK
jgi:hypothetical protein